MMPNKNWTIRYFTRIVAFYLFLFSSIPSAHAQEKDFTKIAPLLSGMGDLHYPVSTDSDLAQQYFNQGLVLAYGFNHREAHRSFRQAALLDSTLAMAWWGQALVLGPNINADMSPEDAPIAFSAIQRAVRHAPQATQKEQDLIWALTKRYTPEHPGDRAVLDKAYALAMKQIADKYPEDYEIQTLYAEALMDLHPWNYWKKNGEPQAWTPAILERLEYVLRQESDHPGANHFYIHAVEASQKPEIALPSARILEDEVPGAGHLVHMPSHIYIRTGDYHRGTLANERAVKADNAYVTQCRQQGIYPLAYVPHNYHFLWATATMEGRSARSIQAAKNTARLVDTSTMRQPGMGTLQHYWSIPLYAYVRFGQWEEILKYPEPAEDLLYPRGIWHYARGLAFTAEDQLDKAKQVLNRLEKIAADEKLEEITIWDINTTHKLMQIATHVLRGEIAAHGQDYRHAIDELRTAVEIEDQLNYNEPPDWFFPVRHNLGAVLLTAGMPEKAEAVYRADLKKFPDNGWSLFGLYQSFKQQGKEKEAEGTWKRFVEAWQYADVELEASRMM